MRCPPVEIRQCTYDTVRGVGSPAQCPQARRPRRQCLLWYSSRAGFAGVSPRAQVTSGWYLGPVSPLCWNGLSARPRAPSKGPGQTPSKALDRPEPTDGSRQPQARWEKSGRFPKWPFLCQQNKCHKKGSGSGRGRNGHGTCGAGGAPVSMGGAEQGAWPAAGRLLQS